MILNEVLLYMSDVYLHDCASRPHPLHVHCFSLLSQSRFVSLTNFCLLSLITMSALEEVVSETYLIICHLEEQEHIVGPAIAQTARQLIQINAIPPPHYFYNVEGNT